MKKTLLIIVAFVGALAGLVAVVVRTGVYNVAADEPHSPLVYSLLETTRQRSIAARAAKIQAPDLEDPERVRRGAGNYDAMCASCHLSPGAPESELSIGLYPAPPNLARAADVDAAAAFWVIKHGIKSTGMPAWGAHMEDPYIWDLVAFLRRLPTLSAEQYKAEVAASGGHSHGGDESGGHGHDDLDAEPHEHASEPPAAATVHTHTDGKQHVHEAQ